MAVSSKPAESDDVARASAQPKVGEQKPSREVASEAGRENAASASARPDADVVAMVSRDVNGDPAQSENFVVMVADDASDRVKDAHWNKAGEALGAKHVGAGWRDGDGDGVDVEARAEAERGELDRINFRSGS